MSMGVLDRRHFGALTNKDYAFKGRPWELQNNIFFDVFDINVTQLRADFRESNILRILPKKIPNSNVWITDRARFQYLAYNKFRLKQPNIFLNNTMYTITSINLLNWFFYIWNRATKIARSTLLLFFYNARKSQFDIGFNFSLGSSIGGKLLNKLKSFGEVVGQKIKKETKESDFIYYYDKMKIFVDVRKILLIGLDLRLWFPQLNYHFRQQTKKGNVIFSLGSRIYYNFQNQHLGSSISDIKKFLVGQHWHNNNMGCSVFVNQKVVEIIETKFNNNIFTVVGEEQLCVLENKPSDLAFDNISFRNHLNLGLNHVHSTWTKKRQLFFSMIQPVEKAKTFLNVFFGIHSVQSFTSNFRSIANVQIPFEAPTETDESFLVYNGQWIIQTPTYRNKTKLNIFDTLGEVILFWNETFIHRNEKQPGLIQIKGKISNKYFRFFDTNKFFIDIPFQSAGVLDVLEKIRKTKRTKYTKCSL